MKRLIPFVVLLALTACNLTGIGNNGTTPITNAANATVLDEQIGIGAETAYATASKLGTALARAGVIDKAAFKAADQKAYTALLATRAAYDAGNSGSYIGSAKAVYAAVADIRALVK